MGCRVKAIRITAEKRVGYVDVETLADGQEIVGGLIEPIDLRRGDGTRMYVNEEGALIGLPFNSIATDLALNAIMPWTAAILGDVYIIGPGDGNGYDTDVNLDGPAVRFLRKVADEAGGTWEP